MSDFYVTYGMALDRMGSWHFQAFEDGTQGPGCIKMALTAQPVAHTNWPEVN